METQHTNIKLMELLLQWDPLGYGEDSYETEVVDVLQAVHSIDDEMVLARKIQAIYEFSFEEIIPLEQCKGFSKQLLFIKNTASCEL